MKYILMIICMCCFVSGRAQSTANIKSGTRLVGSGNLRTVFGVSSLVNNGVITDAAGTLMVDGNTQISGTGSTTLFNLTVNSGKSLTELSGHTIHLNNAITNNGSLTLNGLIDFSGTNQ